METFQKNQEITRFFPEKRLTNSKGWLILDMFGYSHNFGSKPYKGRIFIMFKIVTKKELNANVTLMEMAEKQPQSIIFPGTG